MSSAVTWSLVVKDTSVTEPHGVGTLRASPFILPSSAGMTFPMAFAAPVDVGMMERDAACLV